MSFNTNLKRLREEKNLTNKEVSNLLGLHLESYRKYENGLREPSFEVLLKICKILSCTPNDLLL